MVEFGGEFGVLVGGRDAGAGVMGGFGVVVAVVVWAVVEEERERRGRGIRRGWKGEDWTRIGRRKSAERSARDVYGVLSDMFELG